MEELHKIKIWCPAKGGDLGPAKKMSGRYAGTVYPAIGGILYMIDKIT